MSSTNAQTTSLLASVESNARTYARKFPVSFATGNGLYLTDKNGTKYLDFLQCAGALPLGHNHPVVREAILEYLDSQLPQQALDMSTTAKEAFVAELWNWLPKAFQADAKVHFCSPSGSDAVEAAMKLVRIATGRSTIIAFDGGYHGHTAGALAAMGNIGAKSQLKTGVLGDIAFFPYPNEDYSPFGLENSPALSAELSIKYLERRLADPESGMTKPAGIIVECIQGEGGIVPAPSSWLRELRRIATKFDIPLIFDEVQSGFGRSGTGFAFEHAEGVIPDVLIMSKAVGGSMPLACLAYHSRLDVWEPGSHAGTFRGSQLSFVTGARVLKYLREQNLAAHAASMGNEFKAQFLKSADAFGISDRILSIRGRGLMMGVQLVAAGTRVEDGELAGRVQRVLFDVHKVIIERGGRHGSVLRLLPPLTIQLEDVKLVADLLAKAISEVI